MLTVEIDGNDGTGKTFLINEIKRQLAFTGFKGDVKFTPKDFILQRIFIYINRPRPIPKNPAV